MTRPSEIFAPAPAAEPLPKWRPTVKTVERLILEGQAPFLMRRQITLSLHKEDSYEDKADEGGREEVVDTEKLTSGPRRAVICSFPQVSGGFKRFNLSLEEAGHIAIFWQNHEINQIKP